MRSILISVKPEEVKKILNNEKIIETRNTVPKCELPCKVYISNNKPVFTIEKKKKQELNHELIKSYDDLKLFIQSLLTVKDLISDQQKIKINNEQSTTMTSINKHSEYKMIYQLFDLKNDFFKNLINIKNML